VSVDVVIGSPQQSVRKARLQQVHCQEWRILHYLCTTKTTTTTQELQGEVDLGNLSMIGQTGAPKKGGLGKTDNVRQAKKHFLGNRASL